ncbi:MAG TPA: ABC transporter substrate-binding protein [Candidatus Paceibacterota bacterium]
MQNLRPFQIIVMAIFGVIALVGIALFASFQGFSSGVPQVGTVTIWGTLPANEMNMALGEYKQAHQEYGKVSYTQRPQETFDQDLAEAIASGRGPDLIVISQEDLASAQSKLGMIPSSTISERDFRSSFLPIGELFLTTGGTYGIPFLVDPLILYYNRPILASAGVTQPPSTWEAVSGLAGTVNREGEGQVVSRSLIALGTYENIDHARAIISLLFMQAGYQITTRTTNGIESDLDTMKGTNYGIRPTESALNFYTEFANPTKTVYSWNRSLPQSRDAFVAGDLALYLGFASERKALAAANPNLDFDMAPVPSPGTSQTRVTYGKAYAFAVPRTSANAEGAVRVARSFSDAKSVAAFARKLGMAPAVRAALAPSKDDLYEPVFYPEALVARGWLSPAPTDTDTIFATMIRNVASGRESVNNAISTASQSINASY